MTVQDAAKIFLTVLTNLETNRDLVDGYRLDLHNYWVFPDRFTYKCKPYERVVSLNYNNEVVGTSLFAINPSGLEIRWVQGVGRAIPKHPNWFEHLVGQIIYSAIGVLDNPKEQISCEYLRYGRSADLESLQGHESALKYVTTKLSEIKDPNELKKLAQRKKEIEEGIKLLRSRLELYGKVRDRFFENTGYLNLKKKRVRTLMETYHVVNAFYKKPKFTDLLKQRFFRSRAK